MKDTPVLQTFGHIHVIRDDLYPGGTKARALKKVLANYSEDLFVLASVATGHGGLALAYAAQQAGKKAVVVMPWRKRENFTPVMNQIEAQGGTIELVPRPNYFHQFVVPYAEQYAQSQKNTRLFSVGLKGIEAVESEMTRAAQSLNINPPEVWTVGGTGTLSRSLQKAWPDARFVVVDVVKNGEGDFGRAEVISAPQRFEQLAFQGQRPPFDSALNYDAKAWAFVKSRGVKGALFWNVAGNLKSAQKTV